MSGNPEIDTDRILFDACAADPGHGKLFVTAWVVIRESGSGLSICESHWHNILLGVWDYEETLIDEFSNIEPNNYEVTEPGCYVMHALFAVKTDSDDYRKWNYLEEKIIEFEYQCTIEEYDTPMETFTKLTEDKLDHLFEA